MSNTPLNEEAVDAGAKALFLRERKFHEGSLFFPEPPNWEDLNGTSLEHYRDNARAVLSALPTPLKTPEGDTLEFEMTATAANGVQIPMKFVVSYPTNYGFYAVKAVEELSTMTTELYQQMINRSDMSTLEALMNLKDEGNDDE
ncbi:hypothetical protein [Glutamicibacter ardleyensis]|nr:hypothetical protein [Glutamicibacter ardleyensis]